MQQEVTPQQVTKQVTSASSFFFEGIKLMLLCLVQKKYISASNFYFPRQRCSTKFSLKIQNSYIMSTEVGGKKRNSVETHNLQGKVFHIFYESNFYFVLLLLWLFHPGLCFLNRLISYKLRLFTSEYRIVNCVLYTHTHTHTHTHISVCVYLVPYLFAVSNAKGKFWMWTLYYETHDYYYVCQCCGFVDAGN
ncbi:unnamed protein product [Cuscuta epithymum]|uniref:Uncharacterized protein n=1 Tax=Cuscuta epithymum TaxID=186058 RepID=A0AAV0EYV1_9ASTE|nr:unnamed protein product [Cuscuta epithymum]